MLANAEQQASDFNSSWFSQLVNDAGAEAGGKIGASGQSLVKALMLPGDVATGQTPFDPRSGLSGQDPATLDRAAELSGSIGLSSLPLPKPTNSLGMFGGRMAKTADLDALNKAQALEASGAPREAIWNETGWFKGADGEWRFEIDDSASQFNGLNPEPQTTPIRAAMKHPGLYDAYPDLIPVQTREATIGGGTSGSYYGPELGEAINISWSAPDKRSVMLHEVQHAIQQREGWSSGGNSSQFGGDVPNPSADVYRTALDTSPELQELTALRNSAQMQGEIQKSNEIWRNEFQRKADELEEIDTPEAMAQLDALFDRYNQKVQAAFPAMARAEHLAASLRSQGIPASKPSDVLKPTEAYTRLAGEVEARNVQTRKDMPPAQRRAQAPWLTQDVPESQQIIRMRGL